MRYLLLVGLSFAALVVACGDDDADTETDPTATATAVTAAGEPTNAPSSGERAEIEAVCPAESRELCADIWQSNLETAISGSVLCVDDAAGTWVIELADDNELVVGDECVGAESHTVVAVYYPEEE